MQKKTAGKPQQERTKIDTQKMFGISVQALDALRDAVKKDTECAPNNEDFAIAAFKGAAKFKGRERDAYIYLAGLRAEYVCLRSHPLVGMAISIRNHEARM